MNKLERQIITTADGSVTIHLPEWDEQYHSKHGAIQEALHVFIKMGLEHIVHTYGAKKLSILEIGFGTGLNAFITFLEAEKLRLEIDYTGVEAFPVTAWEIKNLNYTEALSADDKSEIFEKLHRVPWGIEVEISRFFRLIKQQKYFQEIKDSEAYDLIYFDAFGARVQPELWNTKMFENMYEILKSGGVLVTYAAKGSVRRVMKGVGFEVERLPGPPGKREMLRATKI